VIGLDAATAIGQRGDRYLAALSPEWEILGPNGGYVAAIALRAAGTTSRFDRPASLAGHFLAVANFDQVDIDVKTLRSSRRAESMKVVISQGERPIFVGLVWSTDHLAGVDYTDALPPDAPNPEGLPSLLELRAAAGLGPLGSFWQNLDARPVAWVHDDRRSPGSHCEDLSWYRFTTSLDRSDRWLDACRSVILAEGPVGLAAFPITGPALHLAVVFHRSAPDDEWLLARARAFSAAEGLVGGHTDIWTMHGTLIATANSQLLSPPQNS